MCCTELNVSFATFKYIIFDNTVCHCIIVLKMFNQCTILAAFTAALQHVMHFVLIAHLPLSSHRPITETSSVGLFYPECDSDQCLLPHRRLNCACYEDAIYEVCIHLFHRSCHWHTLLHCHPAAPARGLTSIHISFYPLSRKHLNSPFFFCFAEKTIAMRSSYSHLGPLSPAFVLFFQVSHTLEGFWFSFIWGWWGILCSLFGDPL